jgi:hypothetical protein
MRGQGLQNHRITNRFSQKKRAIGIQKPIKNWEILREGEKAASQAVLVKSGALCKLFIRCKADCATQEAGSNSMFHFFLQAEYCMPPV